jgi:hypothetical protein
MFLPLQCGVVRGLGWGPNRGHLLKIADQIQRVPQKRRQRHQQAAQPHQQASQSGQQAAQQHQQAAQPSQQAAQRHQQAAQLNNDNLLQAAAQLQIIPQQIGKKKLKKKLKGQSLLKLNDD